MNHKLLADFLTYLVIMGGAITIMALAAKASKWKAMAKASIPKLELDAISRALEGCLWAWFKAPNATHAWCCHHEQLVERVNGLEGALDRTMWMLRHKKPDELVTRFENFRPITTMTAEELAGVGWDFDAHMYTHPTLTPDDLLNRYYGDVPQGTWNGSSIFERKAQ